jgi:hypothetical protein
MLRQLGSVLRGLGSLWSSSPVEAVVLRSEVDVDAEFYRSLDFLEGRYGAYRGMGRNVTHSHHPERVASMDLVRGWMR